MFCQQQGHKGKERWKFNIENAVVSTLTDVSALLTVYKHCLKRNPKGKRLAELFKLLFGNLKTIYEIRLA